MESISPSQLLDLVVETLSWCSADNQTLPDEVVAYSLFEQFDVGAHSFLHESSLSVLIKDGLISDEIAAACRDIRVRWFQLTKTDWTIQEIRMDASWSALFEFCGSTVTHLKVRSKNELM